MGSDNYSVVMLNAPDSYGACNSWSDTYAMYIIELHRRLVPDLVMLLYGCMSPWQMLTCCTLDSWQLQRLNFPNFRSIGSFQELLILVHPVEVEVMRKIVVEDWEVNKQAAFEQ